jgi:hypothetical protein
MAQQDLNHHHARWVPDAEMEEHLAHIEEDLFGLVPLKLVSQLLVPGLA